METKKVWGMKMGRVKTATAILLLSLLCGCGDGLVDVRAKMLIDGQPLSGASVTLIAAPDSGGHEAYGSTNEQGIVEAFTTVKRGDGVKPGNYRVLVNKSTDDAPKEIPRIDFKDPEALKRFQETTKAGNVAYTRTALPRVYLDPSQTPLQQKIEPDTDEIVLEINSNAGK